MLGITSFPLFIIAVLLLNVTPGPDTAYIVARSVSQGRRAGIVSVLGISTGCVVHTLAIAFGLTAILAASAAAFTVIKVAGAAYLIYLGARMIFAKNQGAVTPGNVEVKASGDLGAGSSVSSVSSVSSLSSVSPLSPASSLSSASSVPLESPASPASLESPDWHTSPVQATDTRSSRQLAPKSLRSLYVQGFWTNVLNPKVVLFFVSFFPQFVSADSPHKALAFMTLGAAMIVTSTVWNGFVAWIAGSVTERMRGQPGLKRWLDRTVGTAFVGLGIRLAAIHR